MAPEADKIRAKLQSYSVASQNELCPLHDYHAHCCAYDLIDAGQGVARGIAAHAWHVVR